MRKAKFYKIIFLCFLLKHDVGRVKTIVTQVSAAAIVENEVYGKLTEMDYENANNKTFYRTAKGFEVNNDSSVEIFEGDMLLDDYDYIGEVITDVRKKWLKIGNVVIVPFTFSAEASEQQRADIAKVVKEFETKTCVRITERNNEPNWIHININSIGCLSRVGMKGGRQEIRAGGCLGEGGSFGKLAHEVMHSLGFYHEHSRKDRDKYITVNETAIELVEAEDFVFRQKKNYEICRSCESLGPYDLQSLMHYPEHLGTKERKVITVKEGVCKGSACLIGQRQGLSPLDIEDIHRLYDCGFKYEQHEQLCMKKSKGDFCPVVNCQLDQARQLCPEHCKDAQQECNNEISVATCSASTKHSNATPCQNAIDGNSGSDWATAGEGAGSWIQLNFERFYKIKAIKIKHRATGYKPEKELFKDLSFDFSDGQKIYGALNNITYKIGLVWNEIIFPSHPESDYIKITATSVYSTINNGFSDIRVYGCTDDCTVAKVGKSGANSKTISIANGFECPMTVDKNNWLNGGSHGDKFSVAQNGRQVKVTRTDKNDQDNQGWGMKLNFKCCLNEGCIIAQVGKSRVNPKTIRIADGVKCPAIVDKNNWLVEALWSDCGDTFAIEQNGTQVTVTRTDRNIYEDGVYWAMYLKFKCCPTNSPF